MKTVFTSLFLVMAITVSGLATTASASEEAAPGFGRKFVCEAKTRRGRTFTAVGRGRQHTQQVALNKCYQSRARSCQAAGCRPIF